MEHKKQKQEAAVSNRLPSEHRVAYPAPYFTVGIDTISFAWRFHPDTTWWDALVRDCKHGSIHDASALEMPAFDLTVPMRQTRPGAWRSVDSLHGAKLLIFDKARMIAIEGRLVALVRGDQEMQGLAALSDLIEGQSVAQSILTDLGLPQRSIEPLPVVRRLDLAADLKYENSLEGRAFLDGIAYTWLDDHKTVTWSKAGRTETISYMRMSRTGKVRGVTARTYDRGLKTATANPGELVRLETQLRWNKSDQLPVADLIALDLPAAAIEPFQAPLSGALIPVASNIDVSLEALTRAVEDGRLARESAFRLMGSAYVLAARDEKWWSLHSSAETRRKHVRELRAILQDAEPSDRQDADLMADLETSWREWASGRTRTS